MLASLISLAACSNDEDIAAGNGAEQQITISLASNGDKATRAASDRELESEDAGQSIENVMLIIRDADGKVVYTKTISDWMNDNTSKEYADAGHGRKMTFTIPKADKLATGQTYTVTAVGYNEGNYTITNLAKGSTSTDNLTAALEGKDAKEIFAGECKFDVKAENNKIQQTEVTLHRQVAGTYGYFTSIPAKIGDTEVKSIRLVSRSKNTKLTFGSFNSTFKSKDDGTVMYVMNGSEPAASDAHFLNADDAHVLFSTELKSWFPKGDVNGDGLLNADDCDAAKQGEDGAWTNAYDETNTTRPYLKGSVFASNFVIPFAAVQEKSTLELQVLDEAGNVLYAWPVKLEDDNEQTGKTGKTVASTLAGEATEFAFPETATSFSFFRNHIYSIGIHATKTTNPDTPQPGTDEPSDLSKIQNVVIRVNDNWEAIHHMSIDE